MLLLSWKFSYENSVSISHVAVEQNRGQARCCSGGKAVIRALVSRVCPYDAPAARPDFWNDFSPLMLVDGVVLIGKKRVCQLALDTISGLLLCSDSAVRST
jgi:hypothetical protein